MGDLIEYQKGPFVSQTRPQSFLGELSCSLEEMSQQVGLGEGEMSSECSNGSGDQLIIVVTGYVGVSRLSAEDSSCDALGILVSSFPMQNVPKHRRQIYDT